MMTLFSPFNPISTSNTSYNWLFLSMIILMFNMPYWTTQNKMFLPIKLMKQAMTNQFKSIKSVNNLNLNMIITLLLLIMLMNLTSMIPETFSITAHLSINLPMALTIWIATMMNKLNMFNNLMASLTPPNSPTILIPLLVMIELTSTLIQPLVLAIRLTANIVAGHIMMILLSNAITIPLILPSLIILSTFMILELAVAMIQAYVFTLLIYMYNN